MTDPDRFERDLQRLLGADGEQLSSATRQALASRRRAVLDAAESARRPGWIAALTRFGGLKSSASVSVRRALWLPAGAMAAALLAVLLIRPGMQPMPEVADSDDAIDMDILLAEENLELYDDLEFFEWLAVVDDEAG